MINFLRCPAIVPSKLVGPAGPAPAPVPVGSGSALTLAALFSPHHSCRSNEDRFAQLSSKYRSLLVTRMRATPQRRPPNSACHACRRLKVRPLCTARTSCLIVSDALRKDFVLVLRAMLEGRSNVCRPGDVRCIAVQCRCDSGSWPGSD